MSWWCFSTSCLSVPAKAFFVMLLIIVSREDLDVSRWDLNPSLHSKVLKIPSLHKLPFSGSRAAFVLLVTHHVRCEIILLILRQEHAVQAAAVFPALQTGKGQCALTVGPLPWRPLSTQRKWQTLSCLFLFSKVQPNQATQTSSKKTQDGLSGKDSLHDWEAAKLMEPEFPCLSCFALRLDD